MESRRVTGLLDWRASPLLWQASARPTRAQAEAYATQGERKKDGDVKSPLQDQEKDAAAKPGATAGEKGRFLASLGMT